MDPEVTTTLSPNLTMGDTTDMCVWASVDRVMKSQRDVTMPVVRSLGLAQKGCICHAILNEGERLFQSATYIYIYGKWIKV